MARDVVCFQRTPFGGSVEGMAGCFAGSTDVFSTVANPLGETYKWRYDVPQKGKSKSSVTRRILLCRPGVNKVCPVCMMSFLRAATNKRVTCTDPSSPASGMPTSREGKAIQFLARSPEEPDGGEAWWRVGAIDNVVIELLVVQLFPRI